jgi:hypothetical protein
MPSGAEKAINVKQIGRPTIMNRRKNRAFFAVDRNKWAKAA